MKRQGAEEKNERYAGRGGAKAGSLRGAHALSVGGRERQRGIGVGKGKRGDGEGEGAAENDQRKGRR